MPVIYSGSKAKAFLKFAEKKWFLFRQNGGESQVFNLHFMLMPKTKFYAFCFKNGRLFDFL